jgi:hypothetical protein
MSQPSQNFIDKVTRWAYGGLALEQVHFSPAQRFRALLVLDCYHKFMENPTTPVRDIVRRIAMRNYSLLLAKADMGDEESREVCEAVGIRRDKDGNIPPRKENEIANDIYCVNQLVGRLNVSQQHLDKVLYQTNTRWLSHFGQQTGNVSAIREAQRNLEKMNNDWKDNDNPADALRPGVERNVTNDVSIIKRKENYTPEEMAAFAKKIGARVEDIQEFIENENGIMVPANDTDEDNDETDSDEQTLAPDGKPTDEPDTYDPFA